MKLSRQHDDGRESIRRTETFTGEVWSEALSEDMPGAAVNSVWFAPGSRTHWHAHEGGQLLHVTQGQGKVQSRDGEPVVVGPGDTIWTEPGEEHFHGASPHRLFSHVAISLGSTDWLEPVSDEDYNASPSDQ